jgi:hypothetical protein
MSPSDAVDGSSTRHVSAMDIGAVRGSHDPEEPNMKRSRQSVSISRSRCFRFTASWPWHRSSEASPRGSTTCLALVRHWRPRWLPTSPIQRCSDQEETSRPGLGWCRSRARAEARTGSAVSASGAIAICAACSRPARLAVIRGRINMRYRV